MHVRPPTPRSLRPNLLASPATPSAKTSGCGCTSGRTSAWSNSSGRWATFFSQICGIRVAMYGRTAPPSADAVEGGRDAAFVAEIDFADAREVLAPQPICATAPLAGVAGVAVQGRQSPRDLLLRRERLRERRLVAKLGEDHDALPIGQRKL